MAEVSLAAVAVRAKKAVASFERGIHIKEINAPGPFDEEGCSQPPRQRLVPLHSELAAENTIVRRGNIVGLQNRVRVAKNISGRQIIVARENADSLIEIQITNAYEAI